MTARLHHRRRSNLKHKRREGVVLLVVLLVLLMVTATATYAIQTAAFEVRAAGNMRQALRTRMVADSFAIAGIACVEDSACLEGNPAGDAWRDKYGAPARDGSTADLIYEVRPDDLTNNPNFTANIAPGDAELAAGGVASVSVPSFRTVYEKWDLGKPSSNPVNNTFRYVASCYGELSVAGDMTVSGDARGSHESISIARAFYTKR